MKYVTNMESLCRALENRRPFFVKLPGSNTLYTPSYKKVVHLEGDIVFFAPLQTTLSIVYLGQIKGVEFVGKKGKVQRHYKVDCIRRPGSRGEGKPVNELCKVKVFDNAIIAELKPHPEI